MALARPLPVPGRAVRDVVAVRSSLVVAFAFAKAVRVVATCWLEVGRPAWRRRRLLFGACVLVAAVLGAVGAAGLTDGVSAAVLVRNSALFVGVVSLAGPRHDTAVLLALVAYGAVCWLIGAQGLGQPPRAWALPLQPADHLVAAVASGGVLVAALVAVACSRRGLPRLDEAR